MTKVKPERAQVGEAPMYQLSGVGKRFNKKVTALEEVDLSLQDGDFLAVQGATGGGKTTLLQLLGALDRPTSGTLPFEGRNLGRLREGQLTNLRARAFGFIFQAFNLIPTLTALQNVETALVPLHVKGSERRSRATQALAGVGLQDRLHHLPSELSGGQQQRVAIARAGQGAAGHSRRRAHRKSRRRDPGRHHRPPGRPLAPPRPDADRGHARQLDRAAGTPHRLDQPREADDAQGAADGREERKPPARFPGPAEGGRGPSSTTPTPRWLPNRPARQATIRLWRRPTLNDHESPCTRKDGRR
jgi:ABC-type uncharacterized transport system YnjBCD ATPase subunit